MQLTEEAIGVLTPLELRQLRKYGAVWTLAKLARESGVSKSALSRLESKDFPAGGTMTDDQTPRQGGTLDDATRPDGYGSPSNDQPALPSRQPVATPPDVTPRKK